MTERKQTVGSDCRIPDPSDAAADGAFGGVRPTNHRAGYGRPFEELLNWARRPADLRSSDVARLVAEIESLRRVLELLREPSDAVLGAAYGNDTNEELTVDMIRRAVAAAEREAGR